MTKKWQLKPLLLFFSLTILLCISYFLPFTKDVWNTLDRKCFYVLNSSLVDSPNWRFFWSVLNSRLGDWLSELIPITLLLLSIFELKGRARKKQAYELLFLVIITTFTLVCINKLLITKIFHIYRESPTLVLGQGESLAKAFPFLNNKDASVQSFPGDHATRIFLVSFLMFSQCRKEIAWTGFLSGLIFVLPRLFSGAHWLTDIIFGALVIATLVWTFSIHTPMRKAFVNTCLKMTNKSPANAL